MIDAVDINHQLEKIKMANSPSYFHRMLGLNCLRVAWLRTGIHTWLIAVSSARSTVVIDADEITQYIEGIDKGSRRHRRRGCSSWQMTRLLEHSKQLKEKAQTQERIQIFKYKSPIVENFILLKNVAKNHKLLGQICDSCQDFQVVWLKFRYQYGKLKLKIKCPVGIFGLFAEIWSNF